MMAQRLRIRRRKAPPLYVMAIVLPGPSVESTRVILRGKGRTHLSALRYARRYMAISPHAGSSAGFRIIAQEQTGPAEWRCRLEWEHGPPSDAWVQIWTQAPQPAY